MIIPGREPSDAIASFIAVSWPSTPIGDQLAKEIQAAASLSNDTKARLIREIIDHEATHGQVTKTFQKKIRKLYRPST